MKRTIHHPAYGAITCEENIWSGKKSVKIDNICLEKRKKNIYLWIHDDITEDVMLKGSFVAGLFLIIGQERITIVPKPNILDYFLSFLPFMLILLWDYVPALYTIMPIAGGGIGGGVGAAASIIALAKMREKTLVRKLMITLLCTISAWVICFAFLVLFVTLYYIAKY